MACRHCYFCVQPPQWEPTQPGTVVQGVLTNPHYSNKMPKKKGLNANFLLLPSDYTMFIGAFWALWVLLKGGVQQLTGK